VHDGVRWPECLERQAEVLLHETVSYDALHELLALTSVPVRYDVIPELSTTLLLALNHSNKMTRLAAVRHLTTQLTRGHTVCKTASLHQDTGPVTLSGLSCTASLHVWQQDTGPVTLSGLSCTASLHQDTGPVTQSVTLPHVQTSGQSNLTKRPHLPPHMDGSVLFVRWRHCDPI